MRTATHLGTVVLAASVVAGCTDLDSITGPEGPEVVHASPWRPGNVASLAAIPNPAGGYVESTHLIDFSEIAHASLIPSITDGTLTVALSPRFMKLSPGVWAGWSSPPDAETSTPHVLFSDWLSVATLDLSEPVSVFGFEIAPNSSGSHTFTVEFIDTSGSTVVETVVREVHGYQGARLIAADLAAPVDRIRIQGTVDFAIARVRYAFEGLTPDPADEDPQVTSISIGLPGTLNLRSGGALPVVLLGSADFDVSEVNAMSLRFGPAEVLPSHVPGAREAHGGHIGDVNGDGYLDLTVHFPSGATGLAPEDSEACVVGSTLSREAFDGCAAVRVIDPGRPRVSATGPRGS